MARIALEVTARERLGGLEWLVVLETPPAHVERPEPNSVTGRDREYRGQLTREVSVQRGERGLERVEGHAAAWSPRCTSPR